MQKYVYVPFEIVELNGSSILTPANLVISGYGGSRL
jgi:hypothetical protein